MTKKSREGTASMIKDNHEDTIPETRNKRMNEDERRIFLEVLGSSVQAIHRSMSIGQITNHPRFFESNARSAIRLAYCYVEAYREEVNGKKLE